MRPQLLGAEEAGAGDHGIQDGGITLRLAHQRVQLLHVLRTTNRTQAESGAGPRLVPLTSPTPGPDPRYLESAGVHQPFDGSLATLHARQHSSRRRIQRHAPLPGAFTALSRSALRSAPELLGSKGTEVPDPEASVLIRVPQGVCRFSLLIG